MSFSAFFTLLAQETGKTQDDLAKIWFDAFAKNLAASVPPTKQGLAGKGEKGTDIVSPQDKASDDQDTIIGAEAAKNSPYQANMASLTDTAQNVSASGDKGEQISLEIFLQRMADHGVKGDGGDHGGGFTQENLVKIYHNLATRGILPKEVTTGSLPKEDDNSKDEAPDSGTTDGNSLFPGRHNNRGEISLEDFLSDLDKAEPSPPSEPETLTIEEERAKGEAMVKDLQFKETFAEKMEAFNESLKAYQAGHQKDGMAFSQDQVTIFSRPGPQPPS